MDKKVRKPVYKGKLTKPKSAGKPRILVLDDDIDVLEKLYKQRKKLFAGFTPVFGLYGEDAEDMDEIPVKKAGEKRHSVTPLEFQSEDEVLSYIADKKNRIDGLLTGLWYKPKNKLSREARDVLHRGWHDEMGMLHIDDEEAADKITEFLAWEKDAVHQAENEGKPYGFHLACAVSDLPHAIPTAIQANMAWDSDHRKHYRRAIESGALGLFERSNITMEDPYFSGVAALRKAIENASKKERKRG